MSLSDMRTIPWFFWLFPIAFALHNVEEALFLPAWSKAAGKFHKPVGSFEFSFAVACLTVFSILVTVLFSLKGKQSLAGYVFLAFNFGMFVNVFFPHLVATIALKKYCPGLLTGVVLLLPTTGYLLYYGFFNEYFVFPMFWYVLFPSVVVVVGSIPSLFKLGRSVQRLVMPKGVQ
jgi:hypothetical protein